jgi:hypothetical protein
MGPLELKKRLPKWLAKTSDFEGVSNSEPIMPPKVSVLEKVSNSSEMVVLVDIIRMTDPNDNDITGNVIEMFESSTDSAPTIPESNGKEVEVPNVGLLLRNKLLSDAPGKISIQRVEAVGKLGPVILPYGNKMIELVSIEGKKPKIMQSTVHIPRRHFYISEVQEDIDEMLKVTPESHAILSGNEVVYLNKGDMLAASAQSQLVSLRRNGKKTPSIVSVIAFDLDQSLEKAA